MAKAKAETQPDPELFDDEDEDLGDAVIDPKSLEPVTVRVLKKGHGKVHTGNHHGETGRPGTYRRGAEFTVARGIADELEDRGYVEIQDEAEEEPAAE